MKVDYVDMILTADALSN